MSFKVIVQRCSFVKRSYFSRNFTKFLLGFSEFPGSPLISKELNPKVCNSIISVSLVLCHSVWWTCLRPMDLEVLGPRDSFIPILGSATQIMEAWGPHP